MRHKVTYDSSEQPTVTCPHCSKTITLTARRKQEMIEGTSIDCRCGRVICILNNESFDVDSLEGLETPQQRSGSVSAPNPGLGSPEPPEPAKTPTIVQRMIELHEADDWGSLRDQPE